MAGTTLEKLGIRVLVAALLSASIVIAAALTPPDKLPSIALGKEFVYRAQVGLLFFYAGLLVLTPLFNGVIRGKLPIEVSARGAKFAEEASEGLKTAERRIDKLEDSVKTHTAAVVQYRVEIDELKQRVRGPADQG